MRRFVLLLALCAPLLASTGFASPLSGEPGYGVYDNLNRPAVFDVLAPTRTFRIRYEATFDVRANPDAESIRVILPVPPQTMSQNVKSWSVTPAPVRQHTSRYGYRFLEFESGPAMPGYRWTIVFEADIDLTRIRYPIDADQVGAREEIPEGIRLDYTADGPYYGIDNPAIRTAVAEAAGSETNLYRRAVAIWKYVRDRLVFQGGGGKQPAPTTLALGEGTCTEYSFLAIAMLRADGIPARFIAGPVNRIPKGATHGRDTAFHKMIEVYLPRYGWVPLESSHLDRPERRAVENRLIGLHLGRQIYFGVEPEAHLVPIDPRQNVISHAPTGRGRMRYRIHQHADWSTVEHR